MSESELPPPPEPVTLDPEPVTLDPEPVPSGCDGVSPEGSP